MVLSHFWEHRFLTIFHDFDEILPLFQGFPISWGDGVDTIGKSIKIIIMHIENSSFDELEPEISLIKGDPGPQTGGTPSGHSGAPW